MTTSFTPRVTLTLLGIGGAFDADYGVANTNALLKIYAKEGKPPLLYLIDCGHTCGKQLHALGLDYKSIDGVLVTHVHGDHIDGLEVLGYKSFFLYGELTPVFAPRNVLAGIWDALHPKMGFLQDGPKQAHQVDMDTYFHPEPVENAEVVLGNAVKVRFVPVQHVEGMECYGLIFSNLNTGEILFRWSGDTVFTAGHVLFEDLAEDSNQLLFHDCLFYPPYPSTVHTHFAQLCTLQSELRSKVVLVHHGKSEAPEDLQGMHLGQALEEFTFHL